ncbi:hypothetical protein, partial [Escherichia coli]|uniref:hypothetical protein n=1 Tax=Escherichia coli TaxID=562 RepID=UPI0022596977
LPQLLLPLVLCTAAASTDGDSDYLLRQRAVVKLLEKITQGKSLHFPEHDKVLESFKWESLKDKILDPLVVERFLNLYEHGVFPGRNQDLSMTNLPYLWHVYEIYRVLYAASDFDTFWKVAVWMRYFLNEKTFAYALFAVLPQRKDTQNLILPALYEVFPQYFVTSDVMQSAYDVHLRGLDVAADNPVFLDANYTGWEQAGDEES